MFARARIDQKATAGRVTATTLLLAAVLLLAGVSRGADFLIQFQTTGDSFAPAAYCDGVPATFLWTWSDGTTSSNLPIATIDFGSSGSRTQYLTVDLPGTLTNLNIGYDASDDGDTNNYTMQPPQEVSSVYFLQPLTNLQYWASSYAPITNTLDFSGFTALKDIECWHCTNLEHVIVSNLPSLRRICVEACSLADLDLRGSPNLEELRAALNAFTNIDIGGGPGPQVWHFCARDNPQITQDFQTILTNFYSLREPWYWNANQGGALRFVSTNLTDVEVFRNHYYSADFTGQSNLFELQIFANSLTNLTITGCTALQDFEANDNLLPTAAIDGLLTFLDVSCSNITYVDLSNNSYPSGLGYTHFVNLTNRGVTVYVDLPGVFVPIPTVDSTALVAENCFPGNGAIDPDETVTVSFALKNTGIADTTNLTVTLLDTDGVNSPSGPQVYGVLAGGGPPVAGSFTFNATGSCAGTVLAKLQLQDGTTNLGTLHVPLRMGSATGLFAESFDTVIAAALPLGWTNSVTDAASPWLTTTTTYDSSPECVFSAGADNIGVNELVSPQILLPPNPTQLSFANAFDLEADTAPTGYDGGVLEISVGDGPFADIVEAGGTFVTNGYTRTISSDFESPLAGREAWSGISGGFVTTVVNLPSAAAGQPIHLRWRCGSDNGNASGGWFIDSVAITSLNCCDVFAPPPPPVMQSLSVTNGLAVVSCYAAPGKTYRLQYKTNLDDPDWIELPPDLISTNAILSITNDIDGCSQRFYRIYRVP